MICQLAIGERFRYGEDQKFSRIVNNLTEVIKDESFATQLLLLMPSLRHISYFKRSVKALDEAYGKVIVISQEMFNNVSNFSFTILSMNLWLVIKCRSIGQTSGISSMIICWKLKRREARLGMADYSQVIQVGVPVMTHTLTAINHIA